MAHHGETGSEDRRISAEWLSLREGLDAAARSVTVEPIRELLDSHRPQTVVDLGCGTGSNGRWLLQVVEESIDWVLIDHDADLLDRTADRLREAGATGRIRTICADLTMVDTVLAETGPQTLLTASALFDLLTVEQLQQIISAAERRSVPMLAALTVTGGFRLTPEAADDQVVADAFNRHQQVGGRCGPEAAERVRVFASGLGREVLSIPTPWHLDASHGSALRRFVSDRVTAAAEQLADEGAHDVAERIQGSWLRQRLQQVDSGDLQVEVDHVDLLIG